MKTVDAQETPLSLMYSSKFYEVQDYLTLTGHTYSPWPVVINKEFYESLPKEFTEQWLWMLLLKQGSIIENYLNKMKRSHLRC